MLIIAVLLKLYHECAANQRNIYEAQLACVTFSNYTYPDVTVVCGAPQYADPGQMTLLNPIVIFEILSPTTQTRDRTEKLVYYRQIDSLQEYILIAQHTPYVQRYTRQTAHFWYVRLTDDLADQIAIPAIGCTLALADVYDGVQL